jgi:hypothetical protein
MEMPAKTAKEVVLVIIMAQIFLTIHKEIRRCSHRHLNLSQSRKSHGNLSNSAMMRF